MGKAREEVVVVVWIAIVCSTTTRGTHGCTRTVVTIFKQGPQSTKTQPGGRRYYAVSPWFLKYILCYRFNWGGEVIPMRITLYAKPKCLQQYKFFTFIFNFMSQGFHYVAYRLSYDYYPQYWFGRPADSRRMHLSQMLRLCNWGSTKTPYLKFFDCLHNTRGEHNA